MTPFPIEEWTHHTVREAVLELLRELSQSKLSKLCQISQSLLSGIVNNKFEGKIGKKKCEEFGKWYMDYKKAHPSVCGVSLENQCKEDRSGEEKGTELDTSVGQMRETCETRLTLHSSLEVPQLRQWFRFNPKPPDPLFAKYAEILNQSILRSERTKVTEKSLKNWWKNERQKERNLAKKRSQQQEIQSDIVSNNHMMSSCASSSSVAFNDSQDLTLTMAFNVDDSEDNLL